MPNHVKHDITFSGERADVAAVLEAIKETSGAAPIDFDRLIPMPEAVKKTLELKFSFRDMEEMKSRGEENWYDWSIDHWDTKWNAFDAWTELDDDDRTVLHFCNAWDTPRPILRKLSELCREHRVTISGVYADEDLGANCGRIDMGGARRAPDWSPEAEGIAREVWGDNPCGG